MNLSIKFDTIKSGLPSVYIEGSQVIISPKNVFLPLKINFASENSADSMKCRVLWHLFDLGPLFVKVPVLGFPA